MQFLTSLFGGSENTIITAALALGIVLVLIVLGLWVLKFFFRASNTFVRGRNRRLMVIDSVMLDPKRQLIIVRRDNVEHLILTGGPTDVVVESGIAVEKPGVSRRAATLAAAAASTAPAPSDPVAERSPGAQPVTEALEARAQVIPPRPAQPHVPPQAETMNRLRDLARPTGQRAGSLRHTGLLRPVSRMEPAAVIPINPDNLEHRRIDSAKTGAQGEVSGQSRLGAGTYLGEGYKAEGN